MAMTQLEQYGTQWNMGHKADYPCNWFSIVFKEMEVNTKVVFVVESDTFSHTQI